MEVKIVNEGILDEKEPTIYVQRYIYPQRTYQIHRKPMSEDEEFILSDDADNTEHRLWCISTLLTEPYEPDDEFFEIVADIYLDEENPPVVNPEECSNADYNGPRNLDTKRGENKIYSRHDEKTVYRRF